MRRLIVVIRYALAVYLIYFLVCLPGEPFNDPVSKVMVDRNGEFLEARIAADDQWRFPLIDSVPDQFRHCITHFEDRYFDYHPGVNPVSIARAIYLNLKQGEVVSGGSTITMQTVRLMRKNRRRTVWEKFIEITWAMRLETEYSKDEILRMYLTHAPFGGNVVGLETASWRYFNRSPEKLSWSEHAMLAVLPNAPGLIHLGKNRQSLRSKRDALLNTLNKEGVLNDDSYTVAIQEALPEPLNQLPHKAYHLVDRVVSGNGKVITTIDASIQDRFNATTSQYHRIMRQTKVNNLSAVLIDVKTGDVLAYVGNVYEDNDEHSGKVDMLRSVRSSGSILKPLLYLGAINEGLITPKEVLPDYPINFYGYRPVNYHPVFDGLVPADEALFRSLNVPAAWLLSHYGITHMKSDLETLGITSLKRPASHYGLSMVLGGVEVNLLELTAAYASLGASLATSDRDSYETHLISGIVENKVQQPFSTGAAYAVLSSLTNTYRPETEAHWKSFASQERIAWKTGTSFGNRDAWAVGVTQKYTIGVWVGNSEGQGVSGLTGLNSAAPLLFQLFDLVSDTLWFNEPTDMNMCQICDKSGMKAGPLCDKTHEELMPERVERAMHCKYHRKVLVEVASGQRVFRQCASGDVAEETFFVLPPLIAHYYQQKDPSFRPLPEWSSMCEKGAQQINVLFPVHGGRVSLPRGEGSEITAKVFYEQGEQSLYWDLNGEHVTTTKNVHETLIRPRKGKNILTLSDELGNRKSVSFEVK